MGSSGSSGSSTVQHHGQVDAEYNRRMAAIAERQQDMSEEMMGYYREYGLPYDRDLMQSQTELLPYQQSYEQSMLEAETGLVPQRAEAEERRLGLEGDYISSLQAQGIPQQVADAQSLFLQDARDGVDVQGRMGLAQADVTAGYQGAMDQERLGQSRMGLDPRSGASQAGLRDLQLQQAGDVAGARTQARHQAEEDQFTRRHAAAGMGLGIGG